MTYVYEVRRQSEHVCPDRSSVDAHIDIAAVNIIEIYIYNLRKDKN